MTTRKLLTALLVALMVFTVGACSSSSKNLDEMSVTEIMTELSDGLESPGWAEIIELNEENFEYIAFTEYKEGYEAVAWEPQMSSVAHSVVLVRVDSETDVNSVAEDIEANANPRKWFCVEAEKTRVLTKGNLVLLVMSDETTANAVIERFNEL